MIIFELTLTTFESSLIFWGSWGSIKNWLEIKIEPPLADLALLNPWNTLYLSIYTLLQHEDKRTGMSCLIWIRSTLAKNFQMRTTVWFTDLDQGSEMIIFESILTIFIASDNHCGSRENWLKLKIKHYQQI